MADKDKQNMVKARLLVLTRMFYELTDENHPMDVLHAESATLSVFTRNAKALRCYSAAGFEPSGDTEEYETPLGIWDCILLEKRLI